MQKKIQATKKVYPQADCLACSAKFDLTRKDRQYCSPNCKKSAFRKQTGRKLEYRIRNTNHYERSAWLTYDVSRLPEPERGLMYQKLLEAASGDNAKIRNILLDPKLLGAGMNDPHGRFKHDRKVGIPNIAKQVYQFCMTNYGCGTKDCIFDDVKPAGRKFVGDPVSATKLVEHKPQPTSSHIQLFEEASDKLSERAYSMMLMQKISQVEPDECGIPADTPKKHRPIPSNEFIEARFQKRNGFPMPCVENEFRRIEEAVVKAQAAADLIPQERIEEIERQLQIREQELLKMGYS